MEKWQKHRGYIGLLRRSFYCGLQMDQSFQPKWMERVKEKKGKRCGTKIKQRRQN